MSPQDYYSILGVSRDASAQDIKKAFRQIARECHPDVAGDNPAAEDRFKTARKAYETLMDPVTRARYDRRGQRRVEPRGSFFDAFYERTGNPAGPSSGPSQGAHTGGGHASSRNARKDPGNNLDLDDLFNDFGNFGFNTDKAPRSTSSGSQHRSPPPPPPDTSPLKGADVHIELEVPTATAVEGGSVSAIYYRMQRADSWRPGSHESGVVRIQDVADIRIIPGTPHGAVFRERGLGDAGPHGGAYGDLVVQVRVVGHHPPPPPPPRPTTEEPETAGNDRLVDVSVVEALLGGRIEIETPQGTVKLTLPPGTNSGTRMRLRGKGEPDAQGDPTDLYVRTRIVVPAGLDHRSRELIEEFARLNPDNPRER